MFPTRMALKGLCLSSSLPGKGSYLLPLLQALEPESESVHVDVCRKADGVWGSRDLVRVSCGATSFLWLEARPLASAISLPRFIAFAAPCFQSA